MSWFQVAVDQDALPRGPISDAAKETLQRLTAWGVNVHTDDDMLVLEGPEGVIYGIRDQGHLLAPIVLQRADLYRLVSMTTEVTSALPT